MKCGLSIMVPPTWLQGHLLLCQCVWPGYSAYHTVIETSYPVNTIFSSGRALAFIMSIHPRISCMSEKHELRKSRVSQFPSRESIESRGIRVGFMPNSLPAEMGVHVLSRSPVLPALSRAPSYSVSSGFRVNQNIRLSSEHLKNNAVMFGFSFFIFQVKVFLSCEHTAQSSLWVTED